MENTNIVATDSNAITNISDFVEIKDEEVYTTSRIVAEKFGKEHKNVIQSIEELFKNMVQPTENINELKNQPVKNDYFIADGYLDAKGETRKQYLITEKGAMLLIMGFTGEKAFAIKTKFIDEFARMKNIINNPADVIAECGSPEALVAYSVQMSKISKQMMATANRLIKAETTVKLLTHTRKTYTATELAKEMGFKSAIAFNKWLADIKFQFKQNDTWLTYSYYSDNDYVSIKQEQLDNGHVIYNRRFTDKGREFLIALHNEE